MKTIRLLLLFLAASAVTLHSCSDSDPIENNATTQKSIALRTAINEIKKANGLTNRTASNPFCFEFVYPITLSLSNGTSITVTSFQGLINLVADESANLYVEGIAFPFQVTMQGAVHTIHDEDEFISLLISCGIPTWNDDLEDSYCFDIVFPVSVTTPNGSFEINTVAEFNSYLNTAANGQVQINFPVSVLYQGAVVPIQNIYEFYDMINNCDDCACTFEYAPVCVNTPNGTLTFGNLCHALCSGYTQNDLVPCNPSNTCNISNLTVTTGACNSDGTYQLTIDFDYVNAGGAQMEIHSGAGVLIGAYPLSSLPLTINHFPNNGQSADYLTVGIGQNCQATQQWAVPNCGTGGCTSACPTDFDPVCVQTPTGIHQFSNACFALCEGFTQADFVDCGVVPVNFGTQLGSCFNIVYPVQVQAGGQLVTINSDGEALQYWFPALAPVPAFVYPVVLTFGNSTVTVTSQQQFVQLINNECN